MTPRLLLALSVLLCLLAVASAIPLTSRDSLLRSSGGRGRVHGALNRRLTREQATQQSLGDAQPQWLTQTLDHSNLASTATFQQRFYVNTSAYNPSAPRVFLMIGGEGPISPAFVGNHFIVADLAVQYGAVITSLEHRFYGQSVPNGDSSSENLRFLSSAAALEDLVVFRQHLSKIYNLPSNTVWIVFGGSYSGSLAAWARAKYPNLFHGAFATSAPLQAQLEFHQYFDVVARSVGPQCAANLKASTRELEYMLQTDRVSLQQMFQLCSPIVTDHDVANFVETLTGPIANIVQYNEDNNAYEMYDIPHMCARLESAPTLLRGLISIWSDAQNFANNTACTDISYDNMIAEMQATSDARSWTYQTCAEFGWFQNAIADGLQPFSTRISLDFYTQQCNDIFKGPFSLTA
jgi:pimeloyl-ACP methyl ester carboxylesterase